MTQLATQHKRVKSPTNAATNDTYCSNGARISLPIYVDISQQDRKLMLNGIRTAIYEQQPTTTPNSVTGLQVVNATNGQHEVEAFIGMSLDVLRTVLFSRGGMPLDLVLRLQSVSGMEVISEKDIKAAFKERQASVLSYLKENQYQAD